MRIWIMNEDLKKRLEENIRQHKNLYMFNGVIFIVLGLCAFAMPVIAAEFLDFLVGSLLLATGIFQVVLSFIVRRHWSYYFTATVSITAGALMICRPGAGVLTLAAIIAIYFLLQGCVQIFTACMYAPFKGWSWVLLSGITSIVLSAIIYAGWPLTAVWLLGLMVGLNFITFGLSMIMLSKSV